MATRKRATKQPENPTIPDAVREFFQQTGAIGGRSTAAKYSAAQRSEWGKKGGRPKASGSKTNRSEKGGN